LTVRLHAAGSVSGVVTWDDGSPAENATVWARSPGPDTGRRQTVTDKSGAFKIGDVVPGELSVVARASGDGTADPSEPGRERASVTLRAGEQKTGLKLVLAKRTEMISGLVLDEQGEPAAGASVLARAERVDGRAWRSSAGCANGLTGADGTFTLEGLRKGSYTLWASDAQHADVERAHVPAGSQDVRLRFSRGGTLSGSVLRADGRPVPRYSLLLLRPGFAGDDVGLRQAVDRTPPLLVHNPGGAFRIDQVAAGTYDLVAVAPDGRVARASVAVNAGENRQGLRLTASPGVDVHGTVVDQESGQPLPGVEVLVAVPADQARGATTTPQGTFRIPHVPAVPGLSVSFSPDRATHAPERRTLGASRDGRIDLGMIPLPKIDRNKTQR
jgi:hypothetical protein